METAEDLFHACDLDSDGFIDREELKYAISKRLGKELDDAALENLLKAMDSDGDGKISYDDFVLQFDSLAGGLPGSEDEDLDGTSEQPDIAMSPGEFEEKMRWIFSFFDKDGDGVVTVDELKELLNEIKDKNNLNSADEEIENFINQLDKEDRGHIGFTHFFRAIQNILDPNEDPLPVYSPGQERPKRPRSTSWVAPESIVSMIKKKTDGNFAEVNEVSQIEQYKRTIETLKGESDQMVARNDMLQKSLREVKGNNEKLQEENEQLKDKLEKNKRSIKQNEKLQKQNRALEANLEVLKTEVSKMKEQSRELQRACTKLKLEKDLLNDDLYIKRRDLHAAEEKLIELQQSAAQIGPALRKSLSNVDIPMSELEKLQEENQLLRTTLEREQRKVGQMVKLLNEDNAQLKNQLKEDSALIESSNQIIQKLRQALEEHTANSFSSDPGYKSSLLSELEHDVVVRLTPRISEIEDELARSLTNSNPLSPLRTSLSRGNIPLHANGSASSPNTSGILNPPSAPFSPVVPTSPTSTSASERSAIDSSSETIGFANDSNTFDDRSDASDGENGKKISESENGNKLQPSDAAHRLRRVNSEERRASDQIGMYEEMDELEEKLNELREKYAALEKDYLKLQTENVTLKALPRKLSFGSSSSAAAPSPSSPSAELTPASSSSLSPSSPSTPAPPHPSSTETSTPPASSTSSPKPIPRLSLPNTPSSSPRVPHASSSSSPQQSHTDKTQTLTQTPPPARSATPTSNLKTGDATQQDVAVPTPDKSNLNKDDDRKELPTLLLGEVEHATSTKDDTTTAMIQAELAKTKDRLEEVTKEKDAELKQALQEIAKLKDELTLINNELNSAQQKIRDFSEAQEAMRKKHEADLEIEKGRLLAEREQWQKLQSFAEETSKKKLETEAGQKLETVRANFGAELAKFESERSRFESERSKYYNEYTKLKAEYDRVEEERAKLSEEVESLKNANIVAEATLLKEAQDARAMASQLRAAVAQMEAANAEKNSMEQQLQQTYAQAEALQQKLAATERELLALKSNGQSSPRSLSSSSSSTSPPSSSYQQGGGGTPRIKKVKDTGRVEMSDHAIGINQEHESQPLMDELGNEKKESCCCCTIS